MDTINFIGGGVLPRAIKNIPDSSDLITIILSDKVGEVLQWVSSNSGQETVFCFLRQINFYRPDLMLALCPDGEV